MSYLIICGYTRYQYYPLGNVMSEYEYYNNLFSSLNIFAIYDLKKILHGLFNEQVTEITTNIEI